VKLEYEKDGWSRCLDADGKGFRWFLSQTSETRTRNSVSEKFQIGSYAVVRSMNYDGSGEVPGQSASSVMSHGATLDLRPAADVTASCMVPRPAHSEGRGPLYNQADIAKTVALNFSAKLDWFRAATLELRTPWEDEHTFLFVRRSHLIEDSLKSVMTLERSQLRNMWRFEFIGEPGIDAGGVAREWFQLVTEQLFHPDFGLWQYSSVNQMCMQINAASGYANPQHLTYFRFLGRVLGKALFDGQLVACHMIRHLYKHLLGWPLMFDDIEMIDDEVHRSIKQMIEYEGDIEDLCLDFTVTEDFMGESKVVDLVEGGEEKDVTNENLKLFVEESIKYRVCTRVQEQLRELLVGFYEVVPEALLLVFDFQELELVMCGMPEIEMDDWKRNTEYLGQYESKREEHWVCEWFWEVVDEFSEELKARLLQFVTGTSGVPAQGFAYLQGNDGNIRKFCINSISVETSLFPRAHTCFNRIDLPLYRTKQQLKDKLTLAVQMEATGFDID